MIVDADGHVYEPFSWLEDSNPDLAEKLGGLPVFVDMLFGDNLATLPTEIAGDLRREVHQKLTGFTGGDAESERMTVADAMARFTLSDSPVGQSMRVKGAYDAEERVDVITDQGIDMQILNPGFTMGINHDVRRRNPELYADYCESYNTWVLNNFAGHTDRLLPTSLISFSDPDRAIEEMRRVRALGSRTFLHPLQPVDGRPPSHPDFDRVWEAAVDVGMIATMHFGAGSPVFDPQWLETGRENRGEVFYRMTMMMQSTVPQLAISDMIFNGVFERHPDLIVLVSELGLGWFYHFWEKLNNALDSAMGWPFSSTPREMTRRNVRFSGLPTGWLLGNAADPIAWFLREFGPGMLWFASDYPHVEGSPEALKEAQGLLAEFDDEVQRQFFGEGVLSVLNRVPTAL